MTPPSRIFTLAFVLLSAFPARGRPEGAASAVAPLHSFRGQIAIAPLENLSGHPQAALVVRRLLDGELRFRGLGVAHGLEGLLPARRRPSRAEILMASSALGASYVLVGSVAEYGFRDDPDGGLPEPIVSVELRLVSVRTGDVAWERGCWAGSESLSGSRGGGLGTAAHSVSQQVADALLGGAE